MPYSCYYDDSDSDDDGYGYYGKNDPRKPQPNHTSSEPNPHQSEHANHENETKAEWETKHEACEHNDEHATALYAYFVVFNDLQYSRDLRQHYTTRTLL